MITHHFTTSLSFFFLTIAALICTSLTLALATPPPANHPSSTAATRTSTRIIKSPTAPHQKPRRTVYTKRFSFAEWVDTIVAGPETALSSEEAWQSYLDSVSESESVGNSTAPVASFSNSSSDADVGACAENMKKRWDPQVTCSDSGVEREAKAVDAVFCISLLASMGQKPCVPEKVKVPANGNGPLVETNAYCVFETVIIAPWGAVSEDLGRWGTFVAVAQTAGAIMDTCTRLNEGFDTVTGSRTVDLTGTKAGVLISRFYGEV